MTLPSDFISLIHDQLGEEDSSALIASLSLPSPTSIRLNDKLRDAHVPFAPVAWHPKGFYLDRRPSFTLDPLFHAGCYYVQEAASMFLYQVLKEHVAPSSIVLDMCAAPGGKSTIIADHLNENGLLVANEYMPQRANILVENLSKWGAQAVITNSDSAALAKLPFKFDAILVDAPCSGEGMFRKEADAISDWSLDNVAQCVERQRYIIDNAWAALASGGVLIYSTCTYNHCENEEQINYICSKYNAEILPIKTDHSFNIVQTDAGCHFYPHRTRSEGLFMAAVRKLGDSENRKIKSSKKLTSVASETLSLLNDKKQYTAFAIDNTIYACRKIHESYIAEITAKVHTLQPAIPLAEIKGKDHLPHPALALSKQLNVDAVPSIDVDAVIAIDFLSSKAITINDAPKGTLLVKYRNIPLGWVKNIGNRCNNRYPSYWRIRMNYSPHQIIDII